MARGPWIENRVIQQNKQPTFLQVVDDVVISSGYGTATITFISKIDFLWTAAVVQSTGAFRERMQATWEGAYLDNDKIRSALFWGTVNQPMLIPPKFIPANQALTIEVEDLSNAANTIRFGLVGRFADESDKADYGKDRGLMRFTTAAGSTTAGGLAIPANEIGQVSIRTEDTNHFRACMVTGSYTSASLLGYYQYKDPRVAERIYSSNKRARPELWIGSNVQPGILPSPQIFQAGGSVDLDFQDKSGSTNRVHLHFLGERIPRSALAAELAAQGQRVCA